MILLVDNYDSFTFNLYQAVAAMGYPVRVVRNDHYSAAQLLDLSPSHIILSPGPKSPAESGICPALVAEAAGKIPILGVCLGHQIIANVFGGEFGGAREILHGKTSRIAHNEEGIFRGLPNPFEATRYHSLAVTQPGILSITARSDDQEIMGLRHPSFPVFGVQFHPESVLTPEGPKILANFLQTPTPTLPHEGGGEE